MSRLYSTGNYSNVRYEFTAEVPSGGSAKQTLADLAHICQQLKPINKPISLDRAREVVAKMPGDRTPSEQERLEDYCEIIRDYEASLSLRDRAVNMLDALGGTREEKHADDDVIY